MKKIMISLMMVVAVTTTSFAKSNNTDVENTVKSVAEQVKQAPSGTVYGVVENTMHHIIIATPFGKYTIEKKDGGVSFMGISAKLVSSKNGVYKVKTSLGNFTVNRRHSRQKPRSYHAHQAVPRGTRDGELVNKRRATRDHEAGNECPNREPQFGQYKKS